MQRSIRILGLAVLASLVGACSSDDKTPPQAQAGGGRGGEVVTAGRDAGCPVGSERCACYGNGTCDSGLTCASDVCIRLDGSGGQATGGSAGAGGVVGTGGAAGAPGGASGAATGGVAVSGAAGTSGAASGGVAPASGGAPGGAATGGAPGGAGAGMGGAFGGSGGLGGDGGSAAMRVMTETEVNDSVPYADDLGHGSVIVLGSLEAPAPADPGSDADVFGFTLTAPRSDVEIRAFSGSPPSTSCDGLDLVFRLYQAANPSTAYASDFVNDTGSCTSLAWQTEPLMRGLPPGQYYLEITINGWDPPVPAYYLQLLVASECGDGLVSGSEQCDSTDATRCSPTTCQKIPICGDREIITPEMCDDGNTANGDGCSSACQREATSEVEINDTIADADARATGANVVIQSDAYYAGSLDEDTDLTDVFRVELTSPGVVRFESFESSVGYDCSNDARHMLTLYGSTGDPVVDNAYGTGIRTYCGAFAIGLDAGTYYVQIGEANSTYSPGYHLEADFLDDVGSETEPNDTLAQANPLAGSSFVVHGSLSSSTDVDYYAITVPVSYAVRAQTLPGTNGMICDGVMDTTLQLVDSQGNELERNDDWYDWCSSFDGTGANRDSRNPNAWNYTGTTQTYYLAVRHYSGALSYRLAVTVRP